MSDLAAVVVDSLDFARDAGELSGALSVAGLSRLADVLASDEGQLVVRLSGRRVVRSDGGYDAWLELQVRGQLRLVCQRCLGGLEHSLELAVRLQLVAPGEAWPDEELEDDGMDAIAADAGLSVLTLVEEEVLLALPIAPVHETCEPPRAARDEHEPSPFAALAALKKH